ncbi:hypothetical protein AB0I22_38675 [Streptomyces sp. NPDC050610]|uniref:hypothetical protein n=1 Tax=Streptomyces sp. NPDC050610 TaxID=3157097 RepID=UPI00342B97EE
MAFRTLTVVAQTIRRGDWLKVDGAYYRVVDLRSRVGGRRVELDGHAPQNLDDGVLYEVQRLQKEPYR